MLSYFALFIVALVLALLLSSFRPTGTKKVIDGLYAVRCLFVNFYALETSAGVVLFDAGTTAYQAGRGLAKVNISAGSVTHVFLTHTDYDHAGGLSAFGKVAVYISEAEEQMINGRTARRAAVHNARINSYKTLKDGQTIGVGGRRITMRLTPGHTPGSAAYSVDDKILITGDLIRFGRKKAVLPFLRFMNMDNSLIKKSVEAARPIIDAASVVLTGHSGALKK